MKRMMVIVEIWDAAIALPKMQAMFIHGIDPQATNFAVPVTSDASAVAAYRIHTRVEWIEDD